MNCARSRRGDVGLCGRQQTLFVSVCAGGGGGGDHSHPVVAACVYLGTSLQGSRVCCVLTCEWLPGTATISKR